jgi:hypothetical protein
MIIGREPGRTQILLPHPLVSRTHDGIALQGKAVIPQIILSGAISPLEGVSKALALSGISTYWGKRWLDACLREKVAQSMLPSGLEQHSTGVAVLVLLAHATACIAALLAVLHWQSRHR